VINEQSKNPFCRKPWVWVKLLPLFVLLVFMLHQFIVREPKARQAQSNLEIEFDSIAPLPKAKQQGFRSSHRTSSALVNATYIARAHFDEVLTHYNKELGKHGWHFAGTAENVHSQYKSAYYCKGEFTAHLQYSAEQSNNPWTYAFDLSWGLGGNCWSRTRGGWVKLGVPVALLLMAMGFFATILAGHYAKSGCEKIPRRYMSFIPAVIGVLMGLFFIWVGAYSLWREIF